MRFFACLRHPLSSFRRGARAERAAARMLRKQGFRILGRNLRIGRDEIDILAVDHGILVVVEVRARRQGILAADQSVDRAKQKRLRRGLRRLRGQYGIPREIPQRFDLVLLAPDKKPVHLRSAF